MLRMAGKKCSADLETGCVDFYGIFDEQTVMVQADSGVEFESAGQSLTVERCIGDQLTNGDIITVADYEYQVNKVLHVDDGEMSRLSIVRAVE